MSAQLAEKINAAIAQVTERFTPYLQERLVADVTRRRISDKGTLVRSIASSVMRQGFGVSFDPRGRFHDMGAGRGYRKGQYIGTDDTRKHPGHKPSNWYSRTAWGAVYGTLVNNLMNAIPDEVMADLKQSMTNGTAA